MREAARLPPHGLRQLFYQAGWLLTTLTAVVGAPSAQTAWKQQPRAAGAHRREHALRVTLAEPHRRSQWNQSQLSLLAGWGTAVPEVNRPVSKVITLLQDVMEQLQSEASSDEDTYDKVACWCEKNDGEKTQTIKDAESRISLLTTDIEELTASIGTLEPKIENLKKDLQTNQEALNKAATLRQQSLSSFTDEEKDMMEAITSLKAAIVVLSKHHSGDAIAKPEFTTALLSTSLDRAVARHSDRLHGVLKPSQRRHFVAFLQELSAGTFKMGAHDRQEGHQDYAPQSGEIFGILQQMLEEFEDNLSDSQKEEMAAQEEFEGLKAAKMTEIEAGSKQLTTKSQELAEDKEHLAQSKQDLEDTQNSLTADEKFLMDLKAECSKTDKQWESRQALRQAEIKAVSEAIAVLSSDDAHDLFTRTFNSETTPASASFIQTVKRLGLERSIESRRVKASQLLSDCAATSRSNQLSTLVLQVREGPMDLVLQAIEGMATQLALEKQHEINEKDECVRRLHENEVETEQEERTHKTHVAKKEQLQLEIQQLTESIDSLKAENADDTTQLQRAQEDRERSHAEFQATVADQRETQKLLAQATAVLQRFYHDHASQAVTQSSDLQLMQRQEPAAAAEPAPEGFKDYSKNDAGDSIIALLEQIIADAKSLEESAVKAETEAQNAFEKFKIDTQHTIDMKNLEVNTKTKDRAEAKTNLQLEEESEEGSAGRLEDLSAENHDLHGSCDFLLKNFDIRQTARDDEIEALREAEAILTGIELPATAAR